MQIIFQDPYSSLNPRMTIGQAIVEPMQVHKLCTSDAERREKAISLLEKVALKPEHFNRYPHQFSGGQRQRICIARALAVEPQFIICDESVSALDVSVQAAVVNLLKDLQLEYNLTYLFISHDLAVVQYISDRILVMHEGQIVDKGTSAEIFNTSKNEYTRKLIDAIPVVSF
jgi:peptide/nickel transport system ATP-binding protein